MKKLNESALKVGDIILTTSNHLTSKTIRGVTKSNISHAMLYVESHSIIDSTGEGVQSRNTQRLFYDDDCEIHVLRKKMELSSKALRFIVDYARNCIGTQYSKYEAAKTVLGGKKVPTKRQFCSRLVARSYAKGGINLVTNVHFCTPEEIHKSPLLRPVENAVRSVTKDEYEMIQNIPNTPNLMAETTNYILNGARKLCSSIQNLSDLDHFLIHNPQYDLHIADLYRESGYLTVWSFEKSKNEWHYDINKMLSINGHDAEIKKYCKIVTENPSESIRRYKQTLEGYKYYLSHAPLETFHLLHDLYENLVKLHEQRVKVAQRWLIINSSK